MNLPDVARQLNTEEKCINYLKTIRWPAGIRCPSCGKNKVSQFETKGKTGKVRHLYQCLDRSCRYQFTVTTGTIFHNSHLPLQKWFLAIALVSESKGQISANQLSQSLGVQYKTAWHVMRRLRETVLAEAPDKLEEKQRENKKNTAETWNEEQILPILMTPPEAVARKSPTSTVGRVPNEVSRKSSPPESVPSRPWEESLFAMTMTNLLRGMALPYKGLVSGYELSRTAFRLILEPFSEGMDLARAILPKKKSR